MKWIRRIFELRPADAVTIVFLFFLLVLTTIFYQRLPRAFFLISLYSFFILAQIVLIRVKKNGSFMYFFYDVIFPVTCVLVIFDSLGSLVHYINPSDIDPVLIGLDFLIFKDHPTVMLEKIMNPLLTDILQLAYTTYYFIPISFGVVLWLNNKREEFDRSVFLILFCFYLSYIGYILFPALGPRFTIDRLQTSELRGFLVAEPISNS